jgi:phenylalanyl-tRNA synthetase beta chain
MKFSLNMAQYHSNVAFTSLSRDEIMSRIGSQLGAVENSVDWAKKYIDIIAVRVVSCEKHPDADKLSLCLIDDGGVIGDVDRNNEGYVQVVCGAPNVREGLLVAWIPPGATVPSTYDSDPFVLESRELRGKVSNGMLASPKELDISDDHEGILEINEVESGRSVAPGEQFASVYWLDDYVIELENKMFTHRPDCFGNLGVAREVAGIFGLGFESPDWYKNPQKPRIENEQLPVDVRNEVGELVPRFSVVSMSNISIKPSPVWMQADLKRVGIKPINNVVDATNYVMHLTGQPLHAFDYDKLQKFSSEPSLIPRRAKDGEKLKLLGGKEVELSKDDIVISTDKTAVALAGVMGGADTEVDSNTKNIVIECATFDMYTIRRTSMSHGIFTDAVTRFNKGQSPLQNDRALAYAMKLMQENAAAEQASNIYDLCSFDLNADNLSRVTTTTEFINARLGSELTADEIQKLLQNVEFVVDIQGNTLNITAPFWRMDISIQEDIVEEVGRLYGYDNLPVILPIRSSKPVPKNKQREFKQMIREKLASAGANEVLTYSFVHGKLLKNVGIDADQWAYHLRNALSPDLQYYRPSLMPSLLAKIHGNIKNQAGSDENVFALFEIGKAHVKGHMDEDETTLPKQMRRVAFVLAADDKTANSLGNSAYYHAKKYVELLTNGQASFEELDTNDFPLTSPYQIERSSVITLGSYKQRIGVLGEYRKSVSSSLKLPTYCAGFEIDTDLLQSHFAHRAYEPLSQFPSTTQDITFEVEASLKWSSFYDFIHAELAVVKAEFGYSYVIEPLDIYVAEGSDKKRLSLRISFTHHQKTLKTQEVNETLDRLAGAVKDELQAIRI